MNEQNQPNAGQQSEGAESSRQIRLHVDERQMSTSYANGYRTHATAEEVMIDFGLNLASPARQQPGGDQQVDGEMVFHVNDRVILNYFTAKRLALSLGQIVRRHEEQFGELQLNVNDRRQSDGRQP